MAPAYHSRGDGDGVSGTLGWGFGSGVVLSLLLPRASKQQASGAVGGLAVTHTHLPSVLVPPRSLPPSGRDWETSPPPLLQGKRSLRGRRTPEVLGPASQRISPQPGKHAGL